MTIEIKKITSANVKELREISIETFTDTFQEQNTEENLNAYLTQAYNINKLTTELNHPQSHFFFAYINDELAGYLKINIDDAQSEAMGPDSLEIERIYVKPNFKGRGIGRELINYAQTLAKSFDKSKIWLGVWEENHNALAFYKKMGFIHTSSHSFFMGADEQIDYILERTI